METRDGIESLLIDSVTVEMKEYLSVSGNDLHLQIWKE